MCVNKKYGWRRTQKITLKIIFPLQLRISQHNLSNLELFELFNVTLVGSDKIFEREKKLYLLKLPLYERLNLNLFIYEPIIIRIGMLFR